MASAGALHKFLQKYNGKTKVTCYKVVWFSGDELRGPYNYFVYKPGWNKMNATERYLGLTLPLVFGEIGPGLHVCLSEQKAVESHVYCHGAKFDGHYVVPVTCYINDLIGVNDDNEAVFKRFFMSKKNYDKAIELGKQERLCV